LRSLKNDELNLLNLSNLYLKKIWLWDSPFWEISAVYLCGVTFFRHHAMVSHKPRNQETNPICKCTRPPPIASSRCILSFGGFPKVASSMELRPLLFALTIFLALVLHKSDLYFVKGAWEVQTSS